jgi:hypothetical protein
MELVMAAIYTLSSQLHESILKAVWIVQQAFQETISLAEIITLPDLGQQIVLRFEAHEPPLALDAIDHLENLLRDLVGNEFMATFTSKVYDRIKQPPDISQLPERLDKLSRYLFETTIPMSTSPRAAYLRQDGEVIREQLGHDRTYLVWEIEVPFNQSTTPVIRIISGSTTAQDQPTTTSIDGISFLVEYLPPGSSYQALLKAYSLAARAGKSLLRYVYEHTGGF